MSFVERAVAWLPPAIGSGRTLTKFNFTTLSKLLDEPPEETYFIWDFTLPSGGFSICSAKPKVGKSTLARNLAIAVATGTPFLGRATIKVGSFTFVWKRSVRRLEATSNEWGFLRMTF